MLEGGGLQIIPNGPHVALLWMHSDTRESLSGPRKSLRQLKACLTPRRWLLKSKLRMAGAFEDQVSSVVSQLTSSGSSTLRVRAQFRPAARKENNKKTDAQNPRTFASVLMQGRLRSWNSLQHFRPTRLLWQCRNMPQLTWTARKYKLELGSMMRKRSAGMISESTGSAAVENHAIQQSSEDAYKPHKAPRTGPFTKTDCAADANCRSAQLASRANDMGGTLVKRRQYLVHIWGLIWGLAPRPCIHELVSALQFLRE